MNDFLANLETDVLVRQFRGSSIPTRSQQIGDDGVGIPFPEKTNKHIPESSLSIRLYPRVLAVTLISDRLILHGDQLHLSPYTQNNLTLSH